MTSTPRVHFSQSPSVVNAGREVFIAREMQARSPSDMPTARVLVQSEAAICARSGVEGNDGDLQPLDLVGTTDPSPTPLVTQM